jgi:iron complex outermembrane receptor protein
MQNLSSQRRAARRIGLGVAGMVAVAGAAAGSAAMAQTDVSQTDVAQTKLPHTGAAQSTPDRRPQTLSTITVNADALDPDDARPASVSTATRTALDVKDVPQSIDSLEVSKFKAYGINDLSIMLQGVPGVESFYDTRGEGIMIRGFEASYGDFYRDGIRESGQVRRSTANVERVEVLKGPAAVLYGRGAGGGIINLISRQASFDAVSSVGLRAGSWENRGASVDVNRVLSPHWAVRLSADREQAHGFREGIRNRNTMVSPSVVFDNQRGLRWVGQYTRDDVWRVPDRGPSYDNLPAGVSRRNGFAHPGDYIEDSLRMFRSDLSWQFHPDWSLRWVASHRQADQDFDHYFAGTYCDGSRLTSAGQSCTWPGRVRQNYAWQQTRNVTQTHILDLTGKALTGGISHDLLLGFEATQEERSPRLSSGASNSFIDPFDPPGAAGWVTRPPQGAPTQHNQHEAKARAVYVQDLITITPQWKLLTGMRFDSYRFHSTNRVSGAQREHSGQTWSPRAGLVWRPLDAHSVYTSYSKSFAPYGGRGMLSVSTAPNAVFDAQPEYSRQYEAGVKSDWLDGRVSTQFAIYDLRRYNVRYQPDATNDPYTFAVRGSDGSRGMEFSASGRVAADWYLRSGVGLQRSTVREDRLTPANAGRHLANTGSVNGSLFARYVPAPAWYVEAGTTFVGRQWVSLANTSRMPGYARVDVSIGWRPMPWTVTLAMTNLLDKRYWRSNSMPGAPRGVLLSASYLF